MLNQTLSKYIKSDINSDKKLLIDYYIYENDKDDLGKKGPKSKLNFENRVFVFKHFLFHFIPLFN